METNTLDTALGEKGLPPVRKIAFLGSGPTPFSALCFRERLGAQVAIVNIDRSQEAIDHGRQVAEALGEEFGGNMSFVRAQVSIDTLPTSSRPGIMMGNTAADGTGAISDSSTGRGQQPTPGSDDHLLALPDLRDCDLVHFAALIGETEKDKRELLVAVAQSMRPGALIMLRSTDSLRQCLYPRMDVDCWEVLSVVTPVVATRYFGGSTSLTTIVVSVDN